MSYVIPVRNEAGQIVDLQPPPTPDAAPPGATPPPPRVDVAQVLADKTASAATPPRSRRDIIGTAAIVVVTLIGVAIVAWSPPAAPSAPPAPVPTVAPTLAPTIASTAGPVLDRAIVAYAAPGGDVIGAIEPGRPYTLAARAPGWVQLAIAGSGLVWVRAGDIIVDPAALARLPLAPADLPLAATAAPADLPALPPAPAAAPADLPQLPPAACSQATAPHQVTRQVVDDRGIPIGSVSAWSCTSAAAAEAEADRQEAVLIGGGE